MNCYKGLLVLVLVSNLSAQAFAKNHDFSDVVSTTVTDVTNDPAHNPEIADHAMIANGNPIKGTPVVSTPDPSSVSTNSSTPSTPTSPAPAGTEPAPSATTIGGTLKGVVTSQLSQVTLAQLITLGQTVWNYILDNKPNAQFQTLSTSVVPDGITNWVQLTGWQAPISKVYTVQFNNSFGGDSGSFDYRITYFPGGSFDGHGKFLGQITFMPMNIKLKTGRSLDVKVEISQPLNFGTTEDPVAGVELTVSWSTPTLTHYQMQSADYFITGNGDIQDLSAGAN